MIDSSYGLGESIVKGLVIPDEFVVHTPTLRKGYRSIIRKNLGEKSTKMIYADHREVKTVPVAPADKNRFSLTDDEILVLARAVTVIADHYTQTQRILVSHGC